jgi:hypothetical protein
MAFIDVLSLILSFEFLISLRSLLPRNIVPEVEKSIEEAEKVVQRAEATNIYVNEDRTNLAMYACPYPPAISLSTDLPQSAQPIRTDAYGEPSLSWVISTALPDIFPWSVLETDWPRIASQRYQAKARG